MYYVVYHATHGNGEQHMVNHAYSDEGKDLAVAEAKANGGFLILAPDIAPVYIRDGADPAFDEKVRFFRGGDK